jgi:hypothetical protein
MKTTRKSKKAVASPASDPSTPPAAADVERLIRILEDRIGDRTGVLLALAYHRQGLVDKEAAAAEDAGALTDPVDAAFSAELAELTAIVKFAFAGGPAPDVAAPALPAEVIDRIPEPDWPAHRIIARLLELQGEEAAIDDLASGVELTVGHDDSISPEKHKRICQKLYRLRGLI